MNKNIKTGLVILMVIILGGLAWFLSNQASEESAPLEVESFESCVVAGYTLSGSHPRICTTIDGKEFIEELEDDNDGWNYYVNEKYGFEFKYPSEIYGYPSGERVENLVMLEKKCLTGGFSYRFDHLNSFRVSVCEQEGETLQQWVLKDISNKLLEWPNASYNVNDIVDEILLNSKDITVDGRQGIKIFSLPNFPICSAYPSCITVKAYFSDNGRIFRFGLYNGGNLTEEKEEFIDQILSTFRFLE